jgi:hypothetical protein
MMRRWQMQWPRLAGRDWQVINGFYRRLFGDDPWCFVAPEDVNRLTLTQSLCGALNGVAEGWAATAGTVAYDSTQTPAYYPSGVLRWTSPTLGARLFAGLVVAGAENADLDRAAPYLPAEALSGGVWLLAASGTPSVRVRLVGLAANGVTPVATVNGPTLVLSSTIPTWVTATAQPGDLGSSAYAGLALECRSSSSPALLLSSAQLEYAAFPSAWGVGAGVPRVMLPAGLGRAPDLHMSSAATLNLAETIVGAA